jgi:hypothetical protein
MNDILKSMACVLLGALYLCEMSPLLRREDTATIVIHFQPVFANQKIVLDTPIFDEKGDSVRIQTLRFYVGNFEFWKNGRVVFSEKSHRLLDLEKPESLSLVFHAPDFKATKLNQSPDSLRFDLGVDSLTQTAGAMGGDLDPTRGMFWTWQSGYIHCKIEGIASKSPAREGFFEFHLGGYVSPFSTVRRVCMTTGRVQNPADVKINFDLAPFFENVNWVKKSSIMSPDSEAARLSKVLAKSFRVHEN